MTKYITSVVLAALLLAIAAGPPKQTPDAARKAPPENWSGIYKVEGNTLTLCAIPVIEEGVRVIPPTAFETKKGEITVLWSMTRTKPKTGK